MKEKIIRFLKKILRIQSPTDPTRDKRSCMTCKHGDLGLTEGPCRDCNKANGFCNYDDLDI